MAVIAPMATWKPFSGKSQRSLTHDIICLHTMVGTLNGSWSWANQAGNPYWHFGLDQFGGLLQCVDLNYRSAANLDGNHRVIPIETADMGSPFAAWSGSNVPAWTQAQIDKLVELIAWLCQTYNIPPVLIPDTKPGRRGIGYHRQGCNPWRVSGGELWSNAFGKVCPGDRRISQMINIVIPRVRALVVPQEENPLAAFTKEDLVEAARAGARAELTEIGSPSRAAIFDLMRRGVLYGENILVVPDDFVQGGTVYYTDLATKVGFPHGGPQHEQIKADLVAQGLSKDARFLPRAVVDAIPDRVYSVEPVSPPNP